MKTAFLIFSICIASISDPQINTQKIKLSCSITSPKQVYKMGEIPDIKVNILNQSKEAVYLIGSLDGSDLQWRMPHCYFTILKPRLDTPHLVMRCGNTNPLRPEDFKLVKPGETFDPYQIIDGYGFFSSYEINDTSTFKNPGIYKIRFYYSTNSIDINKFLGTPVYQKDLNDSAKMAIYFPKVPRVDLVSNLLEIKIEK